jgi:hypothetical protein
MTGVRRAARHMLRLRQFQQTIHNLAKVVTANEETSFSAATETRGPPIESARLRDYASDMFGVWETVTDTAFKTTDLIVDTLLKNGLDFG